MDMIGRIRRPSAEPRSTYELSEFTFTRPTGEPPYTLVQQGRAILQVAQGFKAKPFEFKYSAAFQPASVEQPVAVVGHRTLLVEGISSHRGRPVRASGSGWGFDRPEPAGDHHRAKVGEEEDPSDR